MAYGYAHKTMRQTKSTSHFPFTVLLFVAQQPCQQWEETQMEAHVSSPSPSSETLMNPAPHLDAATARCGAQPPRAMMMTANGVSVLTKVRGHGPVLSV